MELLLHLLNHFLFVALLLNHIYTIIHSHEDHRLWTDQFLIKTVFIWKRNYWWALRATHGQLPGCHWEPGRGQVSLHMGTFGDRNNPDQEMGRVSPSTAAAMGHTPIQVTLGFLPQWHLSVQEEFPNRWLPFQLNSVCFISEPICQEKLWLVGLRFVLIKINFQCVW